MVSEVQSDESDDQAVGVAVFAHPILRHDISFARDAHGLRFTH